MLQRHVGAGRQHAGAHELVRRIGLLAPQNGRQRREPKLEAAGENSRMVRVEHEGIADGSGRIPDVDAGEAARPENAMRLGPHRVQHAVHGFKSGEPLLLRERFAGGRTQAREQPIPHFNHGVGRRSDDEVHTPGRQGRHAL